MSVLHSNTTPPIGQAAWEAAHTVDNGTVTAAMLADAYQPLDSDLTAIAALTTTSYGRAFLALADAAAARTALALGTAAVAATGDFDAAGAAASAQSASQPLDSDLTAFAGLAIAADKLPYGTGSHALGLADFTSAGRAIVDDADASAQRTTLGLGTLATQSGTFSGTSSGTNTGDQTLSDATITTTDITTNNVSTSKHGFTPKLSNVATQYLDGTGAYSVPAGAGVTKLPTSIQSATTTNGTTVTLTGTPVNGNRLILATAGSNAGSTAVSSTNTTWTRMGTGFTDGGSAHLDIWVGVCAGSAGKVITVTNTATFVQCAVCEVADVLTPTSTTLQGSTVASGLAYRGGSQTTALVPAGAGHFLAILSSDDNAGTQPGAIFNIPVTFVVHQTGDDLYIAYTPSGGNVIAWTNHASAGGLLMVEIT